MNFRIASLLAAVALLASSAAMACSGSPPPNCHCDQKTNQWVVTASATSTATSTSGATATGGTASATAGGGSATIARGAITNNNNVTGGNTDTSIGVRNNVSTGASTSTANANGDGSGNGNGNVVNLGGSQAPKIPVATAYSASLTSGADTCLGSISGGGQTQILGLTLGGTKRDKGCDLIKQTHLLMELQQPRAACIRAQLKAEGALIKEAMQEAGAECPPNFAPAPAVVVAPAPVDAVTHAELSEVEQRIVTHVAQK